MKNSEYGDRIVTDRKNDAIDAAPFSVEKDPDLATQLLGVFL